MVDAPIRTPECRSAGTTRTAGWSRASVLSEPDTESALAALAAAPMQDQPPCSKPDERYGYVMMGDWRVLGSVMVAWESKCASRRGAFFSGAVRELTPEILYWALSPGWTGSVSGDVPLPDRLRR